MNRNIRTDSVFTSTKKIVSGLATICVESTDLGVDLVKYCSAEVRASKAFNAIENYSEFSAVKIEAIKGILVQLKALPVDEEDEYVALEKAILLDELNKIKALNI